MAATKLPTAVQKAAGIPNGMRTATITAVSGSAVTISVSGGQFTAGVGVVTSYVPIVGDTVAVFRQDSSWLILGHTSAVNGWQSMAALGYQSGWSDRGGGIPIGQYRVAGEEVKLTGELTNAAAGNGVLVAGLPAPTGECVMLGAIGTVKVRLVITSAGVLSLFDSTAAGFLQFTCAYPLDPRLS